MVEKRLRRKVPDGIWDYAEKKRYVREFQDGESSLPDLVKEVKQLQDAVAPVARRPARAVVGTVEPADRTETHLSEATSVYEHALSEVVAAAADSDPDVVAFRRTVLSDSLMMWDQVHAWIEAQQVAEGDPTQWVTFPMSAEREGQSVTYTELRDRHGVSTRMLRYVRPRENWEVPIGTVAGGTLERLRRLSEELARANGWTPAQATVFVLTGLTPTVSMIRRTEGGENIRFSRWHAWAERIVLTIILLFLSTKWLTRTAQFASATQSAARRGTTASALSRCDCCAWRASSHGTDRTPSGLSSCRLGTRSASPARRTRRSATSAGMRFLLRTACSTAAWLSLGDTPTSRLVRLSTLDQVVAQGATGAGALSSGASCTSD